MHCASHLLLCCTCIPGLTEGHREVLFAGSALVASIASVQPAVQDLESKGSNCLKAQHVLLLHMLLQAAHTVM